jgi:hypothetical protein
LDYWGPIKRHPALYKHDKVPLEVHATQVTVERLFSNMGLVMSTPSFSMKENIVIVRC